MKSPSAIAKRRRPRKKAIDSIAILPLTNSSGDPNTEYLSDGITESLINNLSQLPKLRVMARSTVFRYKTRTTSRLDPLEPDPIQVGRDLNVSAALINMGMGGLQEAGLVDSVWRPMFLIGALPALLALLIRRRLKEPERWQQVSHEGAVARQLGSYKALFQHPLWRKHALIGLALAFSGVVGLWAVGFFSIDLMGNVV